MCDFHSVNTASYGLQGVKDNMKHLYQLVKEAQFKRCLKPVFYRKLFFSLSLFHSILLERKKFLQLGWNSVYNFNDSDFKVSSYTKALKFNRAKTERPVCCSLH